jgi:hypothetical protein
MDVQTGEQAKLEWHRQIQRDLNELPKIDLGDNWSKCIPTADPFLRILPNKATFRF